MAGPQELRREREQEEAFAITQQLNEQRFDRAYELQTPQEISSCSPIAESYMSWGWQRT